jgi:formamidopyrimidine-DNA glycosylase
MPELPEVETIVRDLRRLVTGSEIRSVAVRKDDLIDGSSREFEAALRGRRIHEVSRRAKNIVFDLGSDRLIINLGMTGRVLVQTADEGEPGYVGVRFGLGDGRGMLYQDVRRFGRLEVVPTEAWEKRAAQLGVEPLSTDLTSESLFALTRMSKVAVKPWLMDQRRVVGIGNIYASEALFRAGVNPRKAARRLTRREAISLCDSLQTVLSEAIEFRGTTLLDYRDATGERGEFARRLRVYDRANEPCMVCGEPIRRIVQSGRSTFFCRRCQR